MLAAEVVAKDQEINQLEMEIDHQSLQILARRQPAASDLRLIVAISKAVNDLERMGDEASRICRHAIELVEDGDSQQYEALQREQLMLKKESAQTKFCKSD